MAEERSLQQIRLDKARFWWAVAAIVLFVVACTYLAVTAVGPSQELRAGVFAVFTASVTVFIRAILILVANAELSSDMMIAAFLAAVIGWIVVSTNWDAYRQPDAQILILSISLAMLLVALILLLSS